MNQRRELKIRKLMKEIHQIAQDLPPGKARRVSNKLDRISLELKKDRKQ